jgi:3-hydroxybutyryl-CoA dehydrogenase
VSVTTNLSDLKACDIVIESIVEDLTLKQELFAELDDIVEPDAILASNTSTLSILSLASATTRPQRVCGIHFFNPAPAMRLVEIVQPPTADERTIGIAVAFAESCGKEAIVVQDHAGFVVNALLFPYLNNAIRMWERGTASIEAIDAAMQGGCNFPMGPFSLLDLVGLDTSLAILETLHDAFGDENYAPCQSLRDKVAAGDLGRKTGSGFLQYA